MDGTYSTHGNMTNEWKVSVVKPEKMKSPLGTCSWVEE